MFKHLLLIVLLLLSACHPHAADKAHQRRLQALTHSLELANKRAAHANRLLWAELAGWIVKFQPHDHDPALGRLLLRCDTIRAGAARLRQHLRASRYQLSALAARDPDEAVSQAQLATAARLFGQFAAYRATLRAIDSRVVLPRLGPPPAADTTAPALAAFYFRDAPPAEALAALAQVEAAVLADEAAALQAQNLTLACRNVVYDATYAQAVPDSVAVVAGRTYRASLALTGILKPRGITMSADGQPIAVMPDGVGRVHFVADPRLLGTRQEVMAYWTGVIRIGNPYTRSGDTLYKVRVPYRIVRGPIIPRDE